MQDPAQHPEKNSENSLPVESKADPPPSMPCVVYLASVEGQIQGRVVNLPGVTAKASSERDLMRQIVKQFKAQVAEIYAQGREPDWVDPLPEKQPGERKVFLPVHL
ncbi:hypothetical protein LOC67_09705 [Stieleria sp. JC731]|nr:hypothetical protein [Stieleria sp. JC731]MCC9600840.1 hypothetical protein [Stieleria sp. JC731]